MSSAVGSNNYPAPTVSQEVGGIGPDGNLHALSTDNTGALNVNAAIVIPPGTVVTADQGAPNTAANAWPVKVTDGTDTVAVNADGSLNVNITAGIANPLPVTGPLTDAQLRATPVPTSTTNGATEATLASFSAKTAGALVPEAFDYQDITYVGITTNIDTVVYKTGGAGGTVVATLTLGYDGSQRLTSVTRT